MDGDGAVRGADDGLLMTVASVSLSNFQRIFEKFDRAAETSAMTTKTEEVAPKSRLPTPFSPPV